MRIFDAQIRSDTRTDDELRNLAYFGTERAVTTAHAPKSFTTAGPLLEYLDALSSEEPARLERCGLRGHVALGVVPSAQPSRAHYEVWKRLPELLSRDAVVAVGEIGAWEDTATQWELFDRQVALAAELSLPVVVTPPHELHVNMTYKMMARLSAGGLAPGRCLLTRLDERTAHTVHEEGFVVGLAVGNQDIEPREAASLIARLSERSSARIVLSTSLRSGAADILGIAKTMVALGDAGASPEELENVAYENAAELFGVSGTSAV